MNPSKKSYVILPIIVTVASIAVFMLLFWPSHAKKNHARQHVRPNAGAEASNGGKHGHGKAEGGEGRGEREAKSPHGNPGSGGSGQGNSEVTGGAGNSDELEDFSDDKSASENDKGGSWWYDDGKKAKPNADGDNWWYKDKEASAKPRPADGAKPDSKGSEEKGGWWHD